LSTKGKILIASAKELKTAFSQNDIDLLNSKFQDFSKKYVKGEKGVEKVILGKKTEREMDKTAGEILVRRLNDLETKTGPDLVKQKQGLEEFKKL